MKRQKYFHKLALGRSDAALAVIGVALVATALWSFVRTYGAGDGSAFQTTPAVISEPEKPRHVKTPEPVKAIYMTSWVAGTKDWRGELVEFVKKSELNSIVIDIKDYTGRISFNTGNQKIQEVGSEEMRVGDMKNFIEQLHDAGIYVIARITVFQDPFYTKKHPEIAVQKKNGLLWKDKKGLSYLDPAAREFWDYIIEVARASEAAGFDELNFDYIRFPSDGNMSDIMFPIAGKRNKVEVLSEFFAYLNSALSDLPVPISADVFGMVATNPDDLNIGQVLENIAPHFDYVSPMVYPSHYPPGFQNYKNPAAHPYEVVRFSMNKAVERLIAASSTPSKLRPWIQDFDLGATYDASKVRAQIQAVYDSGLTSWMSWDAGNKYTKDAYLLDRN
ncbi:MAG: putative glycoside hydrolase [Candidatus Giovannonibacteria bacterium]|nr:MAG: putative glycoside hydrolase [Candidatus Giovannonibacteria bacterium]